MAIKRSEMTDATRENIILMAKQGIAITKAAEIIGVGASTACTIKRAYDAAERKDATALRSMANSGQGASVRWACEKNGLKFDEVMKEPDKEPEKKEPAGLDDIEAAVHAAVGKVLLKMDEQQKKMDQMTTIWQSLAKDLIKATNADADILTQEIKKQTELLAGIKSNTRPRFDNRVQ